MKYITTRPIGHMPIGTILICQPSLLEDEYEYLVNGYDLHIPSVLVESMDYFKPLTN